MAIIGSLATIGTVSYSSVRASARDVKRVSDMKQIQTALELYFENNNKYPDDNQAGREGMILGLPETLTLSDAGFGPEVRGTPYMIRVPKNPEPFGSPYVYRSLDSSGADCETEGCGSYAILFTTERAQGNYLPGPHAMTPSGVAGAEGGFAGEGVVAAGGQIVGIEAIQAQLDILASQATTTVVEFVDDPTVETVTAAAVAPAITVAAAANTAAATASSFSYLYFFITQPLVFFGRKKRRAWGLVYNAMSRLPEDLVIVRLRDASSGRIVKSTVTDNKGRYALLVPKGNYVIEVAKNHFMFPSQYTAGKKEDGPYVDLYHGELIRVDQQGAVLTPNIPIDPVGEVEADAAVLKHDRWRRINRGVALLSPTLGGLSLLIKPSIFVALLFALQVVVYLLFRRLAEPAEPKNWGIVYEQGTKRPVSKAILRIFEAKYNKLLESQVTDGHGRYHFRVGGNVYYLTVTKPGYNKTETEPIDLTKVVEPTVIASDLPLQPTKGGKPAEAPQAKASVLPPPKPGYGGKEPAAPAAPGKEPPPPAVAVPQATPVEVKPPEPEPPAPKPEPPAAPPPAEPPAPPPEPPPPPPKPEDKPPDKAWFRDI